MFITFSNECLQMRISSQRRWPLLEWPRIEYSVRTLYDFNKNTQNFPHKQKRKPPQPFYSIGHPYDNTEIRNFKEINEILS